MSAEFDSDLSRLRTELDKRRSELIAVLDRLSDDRLDTGRRGGWSARRVLDHIISSEHAYARVIGALRNTPIVSDVPLSTPTSLDDAKEKLTASREALLGVLEGVDEESFYALKQLGREEYSVISVLENARAHDHEHGEQLSEILQGV